MLTSNLVILNQIHICRVVYIWQIGQYFFFKKSGALDKDEIIKNIFPRLKMIVLLHNEVLHVIMIACNICISS